MTPRHGLALCALLLATLLAGAVQAQPTSVPLVEYKHVSWSVEDGAPSRINTVTQSTDGYLWIGSVEGLFRFDGVTFEPVRADAPRLDRMIVSNVLGARNGALWVGLARSGGVAVYRGGRLEDARMPNPSREVTDIEEAPDGAIWVARGGRTRDTIARYVRGRWEELGADWGLPDQQVWQLLFARDGTLWVVLNNTIARLAPGARRFALLGERLDRRASLAEDRQGRVWLSDTYGARMLSPAAGKDVTAYRYPRTVGGSRILFDHRGDLWGTSWADGIFQVAGPGGLRRDAAEPIAAFTAASGLTSDQTHALFEDREGNLWIGTELGLDMLRPASVIVEPAIPANSQRGYRIASAADGTVYVSDTDALWAIAPGAAPRRVMRTASTIGSLCAAGGSGVWATLRTDILRVGSGAVRTIPKPEGTSAYGCAEDRAGRLWYAAQDKGLFWYEGGAWRGWPGLSPSIGIPANAAVAPDGAAAILFRSAPALSGSVPFVPLYRERFAVGGIEGVLPGLRELYVGGARGVARARDGRVIDAGRYPWLASVNGLVQTAAGDSWMIGDAGIVRARSDAFDRAFDHPDVALGQRLFDFRDGLNSFVQKSPGAQVAVGDDGRVWFLTRRNVVRIDPSRLPFNGAPPPVLIRAITVGDSQYRDPGAIRLPAGTQNLGIAYTALSLSVPSRVRFRYRLEGVDKDWVDAGNRRAAMYTGLGPGSYRFQVMAANNDGVWNRQGATVAITIPPTLFQTWTFRILCAIAGMLLLWLLYSLRLRQVSSQLRAQLEARASERERIARELHDTLLQGVQGLIMRFQSVADHIPEGNPVKAIMNAALDRADQLLVEGRDRVRDLRLPEGRHLEIILEELVREQPFGPNTKITITSEGIARPIQPLILDEIVRIAGEALFNAALHAKATQVQVRIVYERRRLKIAIRDDGVGIDAERLLRAGREGHYGVIGMHERARKIGAQLSLDSAPRSGTEVALSLASGLAYRPDAKAGPRLLRGIRRLAERGTVSGA